jgi:hypothetical protein
MRTLTGRIDWGFVAGMLLVSTTAILFWGGLFCAVGWMLCKILEVLL